MGLMAVSVVYISAGMLIIIVSILTAYFLYRHFIQKGNSEAKNQKSLFIEIEQPLRFDESPRQPPSPSTSYAKPLTKTREFAPHPSSDDQRPPTARPLSETKRPPTARPVSTLNRSSTARPASESKFTRTPTGAFGIQPIIRESFEASSSQNDEIQPQVIKSKEDLLKLFSSKNESSPAPSAPSETNDTFEEEEEETERLEFEDSASEAKENEEVATTSFSDELGDNDLDTTSEPSPSVESFSQEHQNAQEEEKDTTQTNIGKASEEKALDDEDDEDDAERTVMMQDFQADTKDNPAFVVANEYDFSGEDNDDDVLRFVNPSPQGGPISQSTSFDEALDSIVDSMDLYNWDDDPALDLDEADSTQFQPTPAYNTSSSNPNNAYYSSSSHYTSSQNYNYSYPSTAPSQAPTQTEKEGR